MGLKAAWRQNLLPGNQPQTPALLLPQDTFGHLGFDLDRSRVPAKDRTLSCQKLRSSRATFCARRRWAMSLVSRYGVIPGAWLGSSSDAHSHNSHSHTHTHSHGFFFSFSFAGIVV